MVNAEKFKDELLEILSENRYIEVDKSNRKIRKCTGNNCPKCMFGITALGKGRDSCSIAAMLWLLSEYREPIKLSKLEYDILKYLSDNTVHMYIVRDGNGNICLYDAEPKKSGNGDWWVGCGVHGMVMFDKLFQFIKWEDSTPTLIKDVLENCEVVNDAEE